jgi:PAS domain S-box-containing protein
VIADLKASAREKERLLTQAQESRLALVASEERYRMLWETAPDAVLVLDETGRIQYANTSTTRTFGWQADELVGRSIEILQPARLREAHRAGMARYLRSRRHTVNWSATPAVGLHRDGHEIPLEISFSHVELDGKHQFAGFLRDISERKRGDAERDRLAAFLEKSLNEVYVFGARDLKFTYVNAAGRTNLRRSTDQLREMTPVDIASGLDLTTYLTMLQPLLREERRVVEYETVHRRADGTSYPARLTVQVVGERDQRVLLATGLDISDRAEAEANRNQLIEQLRQAQKMEALGTLAGGIAHDFNNIVGSILGNVSLALGDLAPDHPAWASVEQINKGALRARDLVSQILAFSRRQPPRLTSQALQPIVTETAQLLRATLPAAVSLELDLPDAPIHVLADATQIEQVLMNLCTNAWHALEGIGTRIRVGLGELTMTRDRDHSTDALPPGRYADLWVADNGRGMDAATRARIFEPFFTTKGVGQGTGLGLSVAHGIVAAHGGAITFETRLNHGTTFHVYLPVSGTDPIGSAADTVKAASAVGQGQHVLYVDDDELMRLMVERLLQRTGYRVTTCLDARSALEAVRADPAQFDLVISDYHMPDTSGLELARLVIASRSDLPVVIASGETSDELLERAKSIGVSAIVSKQDMFERIAPVTQEVLAAMRRAAVRRASRRKASGRPGV